MTKMQGGFTVILPLGVDITLRIFAESNMVTPSDVIRSAILSMIRGREELSSIYDKVSSVPEEQLLVQKEKMIRRNKK